jgi:glycosyltransferase involved in cell wall biosynthesis
VSIEAAKWAWALGQLGFEVHLVPAGVDRLDERVAAGTVTVVENLLSLPMDPEAAGAVARALRGRPAILRHHDLPWQRPQWADHAVPDDPAWAHVVINSRSAAELRERQGIEAHVLRNRFPLEGWRPATAYDGRVLLHPVRAIPRKDVGAALRLAEAIDATYWLTGPAEDGYDEELARLLAGARCEVRHSPVATPAEAYAGADAVAFPSTLEGFGNPVIESALARRPLAVRRYPVLVDDLEPFGFRWFAHDDAAGLRRFLDDPDTDLLDHNERLARTHFGLGRLPGELAAVLERVL